ncbi:hypothetical protein FACS1894211_03950 [Clostridia bacterium]|nr:hypothetical protein FACS1894211_03950 [Clostridia bacterium]
MKKASVIFLAIIMAACVLSLGNFDAAGGDIRTASLNETAAAPQPVPYKYLRKYTGLGETAQSVGYEFNPAYDYNAGIRAIEYKSISYLGLQTRVFAYLGFPSGADAAHKVPAVVLVHGAGGTAFPAWVKLWTDRGYAAIAIDTEGRRPDKTKGGLNGPQNDYMFRTETKPLDEQWMYHAVAAAINAHTLLINDERVDAANTGIVGVSWGSVVTGITIGVDGRFKFAVPIYGSGFLDESLSGFTQSYDISETGFAWWNPSNYYQNYNAAVLYINSDHDGYFSPNITSKSHNALAGSHLSYIAVHTHGETEAEAIPDTYQFADEIVFGKRIRAAVGPLTRGRDDWYDAEFSIPEGAEIVDIAAFSKRKPLEYTLENGWQYVINEDFEEVNPVIKLDTVRGAISIRTPWVCRILYINIVTEKDGVRATESSPLCFGVDK